MKPGDEEPREGVIRFDCTWIQDDPLPMPVIAELLRCRQRLYGLGFIGEDEDGVGYGNVSIRGRRGFIVTATQTGGMVAIDERHVTSVISYDIDANTLVCCGPARASSESLTHAALYDCDSGIGAVVHVHDRELWETLRGDLPTSSEQAAYGTPAMAHAVAALAQRGASVIVMGGHEGGLIAVARSIGEATERIIEVREA